MQAKDLLPDNLKHAYELAYIKACEDLRRWDPADMAASGGCSFDDNSSTYSVDYVGETYNISFPSGEITYAAKDGPVPTTVKIVLLHYLLRAGGQPLANSLISFKEIPVAGMIYLEPFNKRVTKYLLGVFGNKPQLLLQAGALLGGTTVNCGDYAVRLDVLPRLPITYVLWAGDEEFPPRATVLFDATAPFYLPPEDLVVATGFSVGQLAKAAKRIQESEGSPVSKTGVASSRLSNLRR
jgi:hypothetical protein